MPFVDETAQREQEQRMSRYEYVPESSFGQVFSVSLGQVFDEESMISGALNREGWQERQRAVSQLIADGRVNRKDYQDRRGRFDYNQLAKDLDNPSVKTDAQLNEERNALLASRREFAQDVQERGSGLAQFLGAANGYILDPISIATLPVATASVGAKSLGVVGKALLTARNAAVVEGSTELLIQSFVYQHKQNIDSPYTEMDAVANIAMAAGGGGLLGFAAGGISGYIKSVREKVAQLEADELTPDVMAADSSLASLKRTVDDSPEVNFKEVEDTFRANTRTELAAQAANRLDDVEVKKLRAELDDISKAADVIPNVKQRADDINAQLKANEAAKAAKSDLETLDRGELPKGYEQKLAQAKSKAEIDNQTDYLRGMEEKRRITNEPSVSPAKFERAPQPEPPAAKTISREREALRNMGIEAEYDANMDAFSRLDEGARIVDEAGEVVDAKAFVSDIDDQLDGLESILVCARG